MLSTGSPLSEASFEYVYRDIKQDIHLASISGGTDLISCFVLGAPTLPVYTEEIQCRGLGMAVDSFDDEGKPLRNEKGELVCARSFPSQPIYFWNDEDNARYRSAYFEFFDNIWRHGDFVEINDRGGIIIYGRSDATLNPGGVRIGTAEIYRSVEPMDELLDSLVVGHKVDDDVQVVLFVKLKEGVELNEALTKQIRTTIRQQTTPRHVPAKVFAVADIPYTISGKKVELAVRRVLMGMSVPNRDALANPESLEHFKGLL
jgi:acetoacetyl-CoA synthetase